LGKEKINVRAERVVRLPDKTLWPSKKTANEMEWICRHGSASEIIEARMQIAQVCEAYNELIASSFFTSKEAHKKLTMLRAT